MKEELIEQLIQEQTKVKNDLETALKERQNAADIDEDDTRDSDDFAQQEINKDFIRKFREQIDFAEQDLQLLRKFKFQKNDTVEAGALVETDDYFFIFGVTTHNSTFNDKKVVGVSAGAPVFETNHGKSKKDKLQVGKQSVSILSIQ